MERIFRISGRNRWPFFWCGSVWPSGACSASSSPGIHRSAETVGNTSDNILHCCSFLWEILDSAHSYPLFVFQRVVLVHGVLLRENDWSQQQAQWLKRFSHASVNYLQIIQSVIRKANKSRTIGWITKLKSYFNSNKKNLFELTFLFL